MRGRHVVISIAFLLCGCASGSLPTTSDSRLVESASSDAVAPDPERFPVGREWRQIYGFFLGGDDESRVYALWQSAIESCMTRRGSDYLALPPPEDQGYLPNPLDAAAALSLGYHSGVAQVAPNPNDQRANSDPTYALLLFGNVEGPGCVQLASQFAYGDGGGGYIDSLNSLSASMQEAQARWFGSPDQISITERWSECMKSRGYDFPTPDAPRSLYAEERETSQAELDTRSADLECDRATGLTVARSNAERELLRAWAQDNEAAIAATIEARATYLASLATKESSIADGTAAIG